MEQKLFDRLALPAGNHVLDVGFGPGGVTLFIARSDRKVSGIDLTSRHVKQAQRLIKAHGLQDKVSVCEGDYSDLSAYPDDYFDGIYTMDTFVHADEPYKVLQGFYDHLKPGGVLVMHEVDFNASSDMLKEVLRLGYCEDMPKTGEYEKMLRHIGFENHDSENLMEQVMPLWRLPGAIGKVTYRILKRSGLHKNFINTMAGVKIASNSEQRSYISIRVVKPILESSTDSNALFTKETQPMSMSESHSQVTAARCKPFAAPMSQKTLVVMLKDVATQPSRKAVWQCLDWMEHNADIPAADEDFHVLFISNPDAASLETLLDLYAAATALELRPHPKALVGILKDRLLRTCPQAEQFQIVYQRLGRNNRLFRPMVESYWQGKESGQYREDELAAIAKLVYPHKELRDAFYRSSIRSLPPCSMLITACDEESEPAANVLNFKDQEALKQSLSKSILDAETKHAKQVMQRLDEQHDNEAQLNGYDASGGLVPLGQNCHDDGTKQTVYQMPPSPHSSVNQLDDVDLSPRRKARLSADERGLLNEGGRTLRRVGGRIERQMTLPSIIPQSLPKTTEAVQRRPLDDFDQVAADLIDERARKRQSQGLSLGDEEKIEAEEKLQRHKSSKRHEQAETGAIAKARRSRTRFDID